MSPNDHGSSAAPVSQRSRRPTRDEVLAARRARRTRVTLYAASLSWAVLATMGMNLWTSRHPPLPWEVVAVILSPAVVMGLFAGRRIRPAYFYALFFVAAPMMVFGIESTLALFIVCAAVLVLGYGSDLVLCVATGRRWSDLYRREADAPRGVGGVSTESGGVRWKRSVTIVSSAPTGKELRQRKIP